MSPAISLFRCHKERFHLLVKLEILPQNLVFRCNILVDVALIPPEPAALLAGDCGH